MRRVGVRELRENTAQILKEVNEQGQSIEVTLHGKVLAHLVPPPRPVASEDLKQAIARAHRLMEKIGERVTGPVDSSTVMREERR
jgi:prevent-host-death family protein